MSKPLFSLVSAVYGVAAYLPEFLESLDAQTLDHARFEVVLVLDGAVDASPELCQDWAARTDLTVTIVEQTNAGVASARNAGLARARGRWVSFPDPDDVLSATYLAEVARTIKAAGWRAPDAVLARTLISEGEAPHPHPLDWRFADGSGVVDFEGEHDLINLTTNCCAFRTSRVRRARLAFRSEVRPTFEDALFFAEYMLSAKRPRLALCAEAVYLYRKRTRGDSLVQRGSASAERYTTLLEQGYLRLLHLARERRGRIPRWCQDTVLYDLGWAFYSDARGRVDPALLAGETGARFRDLCREIAELLDLRQIVGTRQTTCEATTKALLAVARHDVETVAIVHGGEIVAAYAGIERTAQGTPVDVAGIPWAVEVPPSGIRLPVTARIPRWIGQPRPRAISP